MEYSDDIKTLKLSLERKLADAWLEMGRRAGSGKVAETQRMYGFVLGMRAALMTLNIENGSPAHDFVGAAAVHALTASGFNKMNGAQMKDFGFPEFS